MKVPDIVLDWDKINYANTVKSNGDLIHISSKKKPDMNKICDEASATNGFVI